MKPLFSIKNCRGPTDFLTMIMAMISFYFRPLIKGFLRLTTRLCELQRICYGEANGGPRAIAVESSLRQSRSKLIQDAVRDLDSMVDSGDIDSEKIELETTDATVNLILTVKKIKRDLHRQFVISLRFSLRQICSYRRLKKEVEQLRSESYDSDNLDHEKWLLELWGQLQPGVPLLQRKTKDWQTIGFQGEDPKTDFRGMGVLGLLNLLYFAKEYATAARCILSRSHHPIHGYSFAIVGINLTHMAYKLLNDSSAKSHLYNVSIKAPGNSSGSSSNSTGKVHLDHFHHFYCYLFVEFDKFWMEMKPADVMEFNRIRDLFENRIRDDLRHPETCFAIKVSVDTV